MPTPAQELLAANMRRFRSNRGWSQEALAQASKLHRTYIGSVERCERNPSVRSIERIAIALGVPVWQLLAPQEPSELDDTTKSGSVGQLLP